MLGAGAWKHRVSLQQGGQHGGGCGTHRRLQTWSKRSHHPERGHDQSMRWWPGSSPSPLGTWLQHRQQLECGLVAMGVFMSKEW